MNIIQVSLQTLLLNLIFSFSFCLDLYEGNLRQLLCAAVIESQENINFLFGIWGRVSECQGFDEASLECIRSTWGDVFEKQTCLGLQMYFVKSSQDGDSDLQTQLKSTSFECNVQLCKSKVNVCSKKGYRNNHRGIQENAWNFCIYHYNYKLHTNVKSCMQKEN